MSYYISNPESLHKRIVRIKESQGDFRPKGLTLSLVNAVSEDTYWSGWCLLWNKPYRRRLSMNPEDYDWESNADNLRRNPSDNILYLKNGVLEIEEGNSPQWMRRRYIGPIETITMKEFLERGKSDIKVNLLIEYLEWRG